MARGCSIKGDLPELSTADCLRLHAELLCTPTVGLSRLDVEDWEDRAAGELPDELEPLGWRGWQVAAAEVRAQADTTEAELELEATRPWVRASRRLQQPVVHCMLK